MFERFDDQARQTVVIAQQEARELRHHYIGTEHLLLGLVRDEEVAGHVLSSLGVKPEEVRVRVVRLVGQSDEEPQGAIPFTPRAKRTLELALREALDLGHDHIATGHLLLGLVREREGVAMRILDELDVDAETIRGRITPMLSASRVARRQAASYRQRQPVDAGWLDGLGAVLAQLAEDIRDRLGREPDAGDLLLVLACARDTCAREGLRSLEVDLGSLRDAVERARETAVGGAAASSDTLNIARRFLGLS